VAVSRVAPRKFPRFPTDVTCLFRQDGGFQWSEGELINMSRGGVCLKCKAPPPRGTAVEIEVALLSRDGSFKKRRLKTRVEWRRGIRAGLRFVGYGKAG